MNGLSDLLYTLILLKMHSKTKLSFCAVFSLQMSSAIEISMILATPNVTKTNDI